MKATVLHGDCGSLLNQQNTPVGHVDLTFLDPPFNQDKGYNEWDDNLPEAQCWQWLGEVCIKIYRRAIPEGKQRIFQGYSKPMNAHRTEKPCGDGLNRESKQFRHR